MKNFSDQDSWNEVVKRISDYSEEPDDTVWSSINDKLHPNRDERLVPWIERGSGLVVLMFFSFLLGTNVNNEDVAVRLNYLPDDNHFEESLRSNKEVFHTEPDTLSHLEVSPVTPAHSQSVYAKAESVHIYVSQKSPGSFVVVDNDQKINEMVIVENESTVGGKTSELKTDTIQHIEEFMEQSHDDSEQAVSKEVAGTDNKTRRKRTLRIYGQFSPTIAFQRVTPTSHDGIVVKEILSRSLFSADRLAYGFEAGIQAPLTSRLEYYAGISFYKQSQRLHYRYQTDQVAVETTNDNEYFVTPVEGTATVDYRMTNIGANVGIIYSFYGKRLKHQAGIGIGYQQGLQRSSSEEYDNDKSGYLSGRIFYRNELVISRRMSFYIQPSFDHAFYVREELNAPFKLKPYSVSVGFGVLYNF